MTDKLDPIRTKLTPIKPKLPDPSLTVDYEINRMFYQAEFALGLCELHPDRAGEWKPLIDQALDHVSRAELTQESDLQTACREAEAIMAPIAEVADEYTIHCVGHGHGDMNWKWDWSETVAMTHDMFSTVLKLMDEYPDFCFSQSQVSMYALIEKYNPEMLERIAERIKEGRWEVTASHWVEADKNIVASESFCRHILYSRRFMKERFGLEPEDVPIDWEPDTFGHSIGVPTYLRSGAVKYYFCCRPGGFGPKRPDLFRWQARDGSTVLVFVPGMGEDGYNGVIMPLNMRSLLAFSAESGLKDRMYAYGVGDHGGGPTRGNILAAYDMDAWPVFPHFKLTTARAYFELVEPHADKLPLLDFELNFMSQGCYTSREGNKAGTRHSETKLGAAEAAAAVAWRMLDRPYPEQDLRECWQDALFQHFHDILPGCNVQVSREYTSGKHQDILARTAMTETISLRQLASRVDTSQDEIVYEPDRPPMYKRCGMGGGVGHEAAQGRISEYDNTAGGWPRHYLVFNPTAEPRQEVTGAGLWEVDKWVTYFPLEQWGDPEQTKYLHDEPFCVRTPSGKRIPAQVLTKYASWMNYYTRLVFPVEPLTGYGYGVYTVFADPPEEEVQNPATCTEIPSAPCALEGETPASRSNGRATDKAKDNVPLEGETVASRPPLAFILENALLRAQISTTTGAVHSLIDKATGTDLADPENPLAAIEYQIENPKGSDAWSIGELGPATNPEIKEVRNAASGPYIARVEVDWQVSDSTFTTTYEVRQGDPTLYIKLDGFWTERGDKEKGAPHLKMAFPSSLTDTTPCYEVPFGALERTEHDGMEVPALRWAAVTGKAGGDTAGLLLLNDAKHGHSLTDGVFRVTLLRSSFDPDPAPEIGLKTMSLALRPYAGELDVAEAARKAIVFNNELRVVGTEDHQGDLPMSMDGLTVSSGTAVVDGFKKAEGDDALIIRLIEYAGQDTTAELTFNEAVFGRVKKAEPVDLMERPTTDRSTTASANTVTTDIPAYGITTVKVWV